MTKDFDDEAEFEGQEFFATSLHDEVAFHNLLEIIDKDLRPQVSAWHSNFRQNLNSAIREFSHPQA